MAQTPILRPVTLTAAKGDPLGRFRDGAVETGSGRPIPLAATRIRVLLTGGLAVVRTERVFRNAEAASIEATLTFPVPVHATLFRLQAQIGGRVLRGAARRRGAAREAYEDAVDRGRTAVLHEEALRGVHVLSVAHIPPGAEVEVASDWAMPMAAAEDGAAVLRIPTTVGELYGHSPLPDSDDLITDPDLVHEAELEVRCEDGEAALLGDADLLDGRARLRLDQPIDLRVSGWSGRDLRGHSADGSAITLRVAPAPVDEAPIDAVVLVDRSGSMSSQVVLDGRTTTKHQALVRGLRDAAGALRPEDRISLWEFDDAAQPIAPRRGGGFLAAVEALGPPQGGTEIGGAIAAALAREPSRDVLLITDGQSWGLDVHAAARSGRRFSVVLIGETSLEAQVGHLAALTGGRIFVAADAATGEAVRRAFAALRRPHLAIGAAEEAMPDEAEALVGGMRVTARFGLKPALPVSCPDDPLPRAVAAVAATLLLPRLTEDAAAALAEAEGLCCHLTSLVLVDEAGAAQEGLPAQKKVPLMAPRSAPAGSGSVHCAPLPPTEMLSSSARQFRIPAPASPAQDGFGRIFRRVSRASNQSATPQDGSPPTGLEIPTFLRRQGNAAGLLPASGYLASVGKHIDWSANPEGLRRGEVDSLPPGVAGPLRRAAAVTEVIALSNELGLAPLVAAIALLAQSVATEDRHAARLARAVLGGTSPARLQEVLRALRL
jgi:hypothetical protein